MRDPHPRHQGDGTATHGSADKDRDLEPFRERPEKADEAFLTTNQGGRLSDDQNSLKAGPRGPTLLEDFAFREKLTHFDHERIPERVVHARGSAAHGYFQAYGDAALGELTQARFLADTSRRTPVFVRFSTVNGSRGSADTVRDARGFATKFYTEEGVFDLVGNNIPVFFIQDAIKFPDLVHAFKPEPDHEMPGAATAHDSFWDFISLTPESMHMILWVMSDRAIPRSFRMMEGFGVNTYRFVNAQGTARFIKWHWKPALGVHGLAWEEAQRIAGTDPDFHRRDLWDAIALGDFPEWELGVQVIEEADEHAFDFDVLDPTKLWPEDVVPVRPLGRMVLDRNPDNFFTQTEQVAFHPGHVVPGIDFSNDPLLQGRLFSYLDTQISRIGVNFAELPINRPLAPVHNYQQDGRMRLTIPAGRVNYEPNSLDKTAPSGASDGLPNAAGHAARRDGGNGCPRQAAAAEGGYVSYPERIDARKVRQRSPSFGEHFGQATTFWTSMTPPEQDHIVGALRFELGKCLSTDVQRRVVGLLRGVDAELAARVAEGLGFRVSDTAAALETPTTSAPTTVPPPANAARRVPGLSMVDAPSRGVKTRRVAVLAADGVDTAALAPVAEALAAEGVHALVVGPHGGALASGATGGKALPVNFALPTVSAVHFDAVLVAGGADAVARLRPLGDAVRFVQDAYRHCKPVGALGAGAQLLADAGVLDPAAGGDAGVVVAEEGGRPAAFVEPFLAALAQHRVWSRERALNPAAVGNP